MATQEKQERDATEVLLKNVRLSFEHIFRPQRNKKNPDEPPKFNCAFLIDKKSGKANIEAMDDAIAAAMDKKWGQNHPKLKDDKFCMRDGDDEEYDGYGGCMYVAASNKKRPTVIDRDKSPLTEEDGRPYSGCYVNAVVRVWAQDNEHGKRVNASLEAVQFLKDGDAFGAPPVDIDKHFDDEADDDDRGSRRSRDDDDDRGRSSRRSRDDDDDDRGSRRSRSRDDDDDRGSRSRSRSRDDDDGDRDDSRSSRRSRDDDDRGSRSRSRDDDDDRGRSRRRDLVD